MLLFALFTIGYFVGVLTVLAVFPPRLKEIEEQEENALEAILKISEDIDIEHADEFKEPALSGN